MKLRRRAWQHREVVLEPDAWRALADRQQTAQDQVETADFLERLGRAIDPALTAHQRTVFVALALNEVPIDVLAERMQTSRGALYKTLHDARKRLREALQRATCWAGTGRTSGVRPASTSSTSTSTPSWAAATPTSASRACACTSTAARRARRSTRRCASWRASPARLRARV